MELAASSSFASCHGDSQLTARSAALTCPTTLDGAAPSLPDRFSFFFFSLYFSSSLESPSRRPSESGRIAELTARRQSFPRGKFLP